MLHDPRLLLFFWAHLYLLKEEVLYVFAHNIVRFGGAGSWRIIFLAAIIDG